METVLINNSYECGRWARVGDTRCHPLKARSVSLLWPQPRSPSGAGQGSRRHRGASPPRLLPLQKGPRSPGVSLLPDGSSVSCGLPLRDGQEGPCVHLPSPPLPHWSPQPSGLLTREPLPRGVRMRLGIKAEETSRAWRTACPLCPPSAGPPARPGWGQGLSGRPRGSWN